MSETKADTVPGLGFKDKEKALETLKNLDGRDPDYQKLAIKGLIGRAKRTITLTKDQDKLVNIKHAVKIFEDWLKDFEIKNLSKENRSYLPIASIEALLPLKEKYGIKNELVNTFLNAYKNTAKGDYKNLRTIASGDNKPTWDIVRNQELKKILKDFEESKADLWDKEDLPTKDHLDLILWAYSPDANKIKKNIPSYEEKLGNLKISNENETEVSDDEKSNDVKEDNGDKKEEEQTNKRKSDGSSESEDESPKKKSKKE